MQAEGLTGSFSGADVSSIMRPREEQLAQCFTPYSDRLRTLAGSISLTFRIGPGGRVLSVHPSASTIGHRDVERCVVQVARATRFPPPNGHAEATFTWPLSMDPADDAEHPMHWDARQINRQVRRHSRDVRRRCSLSARERVQVTVYISRTGRVLAAGAAVNDADDQPKLDCVVDAVRRWPMPPARRQAKVTFDLG
jgi:TonB family protein